MLTIEQLKAMPPSTVFATGLTVDSPEGVNMSNSGKELRWVACRGGYHDWAIYIHFSKHSPQFIRDYGDKVCDERNIKKLVPCDDEALAMCRY